MDRRIASGIASGCFYVVAIPLGINLMVDPALDAAVGWAIVAVAGVVGTAFGAFAVFGGAPLTVLQRLGARRHEWMTLSEATQYVGERSVWARNCPEKMSEWNESLPQAMLTALSMGRVSGAGRRARDEGHHPHRAFNRAPIDRSFWEHAWFQAIPNVMKKTQTSDVVYDRRQGMKPMFFDVELRSRDVRREWPPLPFWEKIETAITRTREARPLPGEH